MSIDEMNQYWDALVAGDERRHQSLREKFRLESELSSIMDMLDELFDISQELSDSNARRGSGSDDSNAASNRGT